MNGADVLNAFRLLVREAALMEKALENEPQPCAGDGSAQQLARERERMNVQLEQIGSRIAAMRKPFEAAVMCSRSATERHIARLYYGMGMTDAQTAERIGLSMNTVAKHRSRMLRLLRQMGDV